MKAKGENASSVPKVRRILVVAHDRALRATRVQLLESHGYAVTSVGTDDDAMAIMEREPFDLILLGRKSLIPKTGIDQRLREQYPDLMILQIETAGVVNSIYPSRITDATPAHVLTAIADMLGKGVRLVPRQ